MTETTTTVASLADVLRHLASEFDASMPEPSGVTFHTYDHRAPIVGLTFGVEGSACIEAWIAKYGSKYDLRVQQPFGADGSQWLTTDAFELMGMTVQLSGYDPREAEPVAVEQDAQAIVAESLAVPVCRLAEAGVEHPPHEWRTPAGDWLPCGDAAATVSESAPAVWDDSVPPGGFVCSVCRTPVESEPCELHGAGVQP